MVFWNDFTTLWQNFDRALTEHNVGKNIFMHLSLQLTLSRDSFVIWFYLKKSHKNTWQYECDFRNDFTKLKRLKLNRICLYNVIAFYLNTSMIVARLKTIFPTEILKNCAIFCLCSQNWYFVTKIVLTYCEKKLFTMEKIIGI